MTKYELNQHDVKNDGRIILYQRPRKDGSIIPTWQMRISVPNSTGYKRASTGHKEQSEAIRKAINTYEELYMKVLGGGSLQSKSFKDAFIQWEIDLPKLVIGKNRHKDYASERISLVKNYPLRFFKDKKLEDIRKKDFTEYRIWRNENSIKTNPSTGKSKPFIPSNNSLRKEATAIKLMFEYAKDKGWCSSLPDMDVPPLDKNRRPTFTLTEWRKLVGYRGSPRLIREWVKEGEQWGGVGRDRFVVHQYVLFCANSGVRPPAELRYLRWNELETKQIEDGTTRLIATVRGKTGERQVVCNEGAEVFVKRLYDLRKQELNDNPPYDSFVICNRDGSPIGSLKKGFESLLRFCDLEFSSKGEKRTLYSLRHFYATQRLSEEVSPYLLARNMGTSVEMLERHYGQVVNDLVAAEITKTKRESKPPKLGVNQYPFESKVT